MSDDRRNPFDGMRIEIDPDKVDEAVRALRARLEGWREAAEDGLSSARHTRVRVSHKGKALLPDIPLTVFLAGEGVAFLALGPLYAVLGNLMGRAVLEVELVHDADELVAAGKDAWMHGELETAEARYREALQRRKDDPSALYHLAVLLRVTGREEEAVACFRRAAMGPEGHADVVRAAEAIERLQGKRTL